MMLMKETFFATLLKFPSVGQGQVSLLKVFKFTIHRLDDFHCSVRIEE